MASFYSEGDKISFEGFKGSIIKITEMIEACSNRDMCYIEKYVEILPFIDDGQTKDPVFFEKTKTADVIDCPTI